MKKLMCMAVIAIVLTVFNGCQKDELKTTPDEGIAKTSKADVYLESDYLVFKDYPTFSKISEELDKMDSQQLKNWENRFGFYSANSFLLEADKQLKNLKTQTEFDAFKKSYEGKLLFTSDDDIKLPFYATTWDKVLNPVGVVKIGQTLYKFDTDKEFMIMDGTKDDLKNLKTLQTDTNKVITFYPRKNKMLKAVQWGSLVWGEIYDGNSKMIYDYQLISLYYTGYGYTNTYYTENGFELKVKLLQKRKGLFGWYINNTVYRLKNSNLHCEYWKTLALGVIRVEPKVVINSVIQDYTSPEWTSSSPCVMTFHRYYEVITGYDGIVEPDIYSHQFTVWSRGIDESKAKTINYTNM